MSEASDVTVRREAAFDPLMLLTARDLRMRRIDRRKSRLVHVRRGVWIDQAAWQALSLTQQHAALVQATARQCFVDPVQKYVFARTSAAAIWGLPIIGAWPRQVHVLVDGPRRAGTHIIRYHENDSEGKVLVNGLWVTRAARTVIDLGRREPLMTAVAAADHALRFGLCTEADLRQELDRVASSAQGRAAAQLAVDLADPASESAGESLSRTQMFLLNLPRPRLQVARQDRSGLIGYVDFDWGEVVGEFDGRVKYQLPDSAAPSEYSSVLYREKAREDRLRTQAQVVRWDWRTALSLDGMATRLASAGLRPRVKNTWFSEAQRPAPGQGVA